MVNNFNKTVHILRYAILTLHLLVSATSVTGSLKLWALESIFSETLCGSYHSYCCNCMCRWLSFQAMSQNMLLDMYNKP